MLSSLLVNNNRYRIKPEKWTLFIISHVEDIECGECLNSGLIKITGFAKPSKDEKHSVLNIPDRLSIYLY
jgi:hypothetical protein